MEKNSYYYLLLIAKYFDKNKEAIHHSLKYFENGRNRRLEHKLLQLVKNDTIQYKKQFVKLYFDLCQKCNIKVSNSLIQANLNDYS